jgi:hypothetical protein
LASSTERIWNSKVPRDYTFHGSFDILISNFRVRSQYQSGLYWNHVLREVIHIFTQEYRSDVTGNHKWRLLMIWKVDWFNGTQAVSITYNVDFVVSIIVIIIFVVSIIVIIIFVVTQQI